VNELDVFEGSFKDAATFIHLELACKFLDIIVPSVSSLLVSFQ